MPFPGCVTAAAASVGGGGSLSSRRPSVRPSVCPAERAGASQDDSVRGANMTSRREARRTTKEDSSSFFVGGEHRPAAWTERSLARSQPTQTLFLRSRTRFRLRDPIPRGDSIHERA